ncbi:MAG: hypothetical protein ACREV5_07625 [Steroidobacter sp.]
MKCIPRGLTVLLAAALMIPAWADTAVQEFRLELARQSLATTLKEFSRQTGLQIGFFPRNSTEENLIVGPLRAATPQKLHSLTCWQTAA